MHTTWQPLADQIIVRPLIAADRTAGGLFLAETHRERPQHGVVVAAGPGAYEGGQFTPTTVSAGDLVAFGKYAGVEFEVDGQPVLLMRDREALARKLPGTFELVEHEVSSRTVVHEAGHTCEHCPREKNPYLEEERRRLVSESSVVGDGTGVR